MEEVIKEKLAEPSEDRISSLLECSFFDGHSKRQNEAGIVFSPRTYKGKISYLGPNTIRGNINFFCSISRDITRRRDRINIRIRVATVGI